jgi:hypothetical protein
MQMTPEERAIELIPIDLAAMAPLRTKVAHAIEDAIAAERARICKILRETSVNATREVLIRGVEEGATSIWVKDEL